MSGMAGIAYSNISSIVSGMDDLTWA